MRNAYDLSYSTCVYSGIYKRIESEIQYGEKDVTEELQYFVDRYMNEHIVSGLYLREKLEEYKNKWK